ncbi:MAG TPA: dTMP kinase [Gaiellaceae bacterium]|nr:dTMP kinase [Gaiellaceae bacterium]
MFVTFEGLDGSGKTTQAELLRARLEADGTTVLGTREPGGTELGDRIRNLVLYGEHVEPWAEALLYAAARAQHVEQVIRPGLEDGAVVICDRYVDSSVAYQGVGRGLGFDRVLDINLAATDGLMPAQTFLLEIDPGHVAIRVGEDHDRLESEDEEFHARVATGYRELVERFPERIVVLDGTRLPEEIAEDVHAGLRRRT